MIFRPRQKTLPITRQIILENYVLEQVDNTKFLGVYIDQHLEWKTHVNIIAAKISITFLLMSPTYNEFTYYRKEQSGRSLKLTTRLQVDLFLQT